MNCKSQSKERKIKFNSSKRKTNGNPDKKSHHFFLPFFLFLFFEVQLQPHSFHLFSLSLLACNLFWKLEAKKTNVQIKCLNWWQIQKKSIPIYTHTYVYTVSYTTSILMIAMSFSSHEDLRISTWTAVTFTIRKHSQFPLSIDTCKNLTQTPFSLFHCFIKVFIKTSKSKPYNSEF